MKAPLEIVVAGAGMVGLAAAAFLAAGGQGHRLHIRVVDAGSRPRFAVGDGVALRVSAISAGSAALLAVSGAWNRIESQRASPFRAMRVWDAAGNAHGADALHFDAAEFALPALGYIVENALVQDALLQVLEEAGIRVEFGRTIRDLGVDAGGRRSVRFEDGDEACADLVVAADGTDSPLRRLMQIPVTSWRYPQAALVTHLQPEIPHGDCAFQRFLPDGPLALLPLADGRVSAVWSTSPATAEAAMADSDATLGERLTEASDRVLGRLAVSGPRGSFPLRAQYASGYVRPGLALIGDAAHSIHPLAGQGGNLGLADAAVLARVVSQALADGEHPGDRPVLRRYERARKGENQAMLYFVDGLNRLFSTASPALAAVRGAGIRLFNRSGPVRRRAVAVALGLGARS